MLINAQRPEELRIAIIHGKTLESYKVDVAESGVTRGNIYRGNIANIQPSLNAAFIDYGAERHGFLAIQDVVPEAYYREPKGGHPRIDDVLEKGKPIVVQVAKDAIGQKGAALTTGLSLAGRYLVLTPFDSTRGVSRKVEDEDTRKKLKVIAHGFELPDGCGVILRTNALEQTKATLAKDLSALLRLWKRVQTAAVTGKGSRLLYTDQDLILQALRDYLDTSIEEVLIDDDEAFSKAEAYMQAFMPRSKTRLIRYAERIPLFSRYDIEPQIENIFDRRVELASGGSIVIDATEALTAIDVNSGRSTRAATQEETALHTNLEAADEVARQLRLRDIGGLVVVDFIDMRASKSQRKVEKTLKDALKVDKARATVGRISPNGLLEINRQRIQQAIQLRTHRPCPTCAGTGRLASEEMVTLNLLRRIEARAATGSIQGVKIGLHPELADAMQNSRRRELAALEEEFDICIKIIAAPGLHRPEEEIEWVRREGPPPKPRAQKAQKGVLPTLRPWDLALPEPDLEDEDDEEETITERTAEAGPAGETAGETAAEARRRKRRRGGRKRKKGGANGGDTHASDAHPADAAPAHEEHAGHADHDDFAAEAAGDETFAPLPFGEPEGADDDDDFEPAEAGAEPAAGGSGPIRRGRRRRRRRGGGGGGGAKAPQGGGGE
ncbi:MAG TPA: Rne/Rng family ribonuclease [Thermoanaerobaculia bacterium]|jgi:ribonuclease E|nr:Rne/Rng family ribonuclease [Thermoanaerobaculia bacterium]